MKVYHNSRELTYRAPFGAVAAGTPIALAIDVEDAPDATVRLRTWTECAGEELYDMERSADQPGRYTVELTPRQPGIVWYHFVIARADGCESRYGAREGRTGGEGQLLTWEPPSFQLTVYDPCTVGATDADGARPDTFNNTALPPFADAVVRFLRSELGARDLAETVETLRESCPSSAWGRAFGLLEAPGKERLFARLAGTDPEGDAVDVEADLDDGQRGLAKGRLWCASLIRALMDVAPTTAYSEAADQWDLVTRDCKDIVCNAADIRRTLPLFGKGGYACFAAGDDVFGFWRHGECGEAACVLVNRSLQFAHDVYVPMAHEAVSEIVGGYGAPVVEATETDARAGEDTPHVPGDAERYAVVHLSQLGSAIAYFHARKRLGGELEPGIGVLAHITSLPTGEGEGPGTLGAPARAFVDWLADADVRYWQVLPVNPTDGFGSPYAGISAFAGNTLLLEGSAGAPAGGADLPEPDDMQAYQDFCKRERAWLEPYACFMAIRQKLGGEAVWQEWPAKYRRYDARLVERDKELRAHAEQHRRAQFAFEQQWHELRAYANERGVRIIGDMPIYVSADSSDAWAHPELFQLGEDSRPAMVAGCPPDQFAADGQVWGNPVYDWDAVRAAGYDWWLRRLARAFELYDVVRLDHFIGFARYYSIPAGEKATAGSYHAGPGIDLFHRAHEELGNLPIIAEDLGLITPAVRALVAACGFPGMDIVQFVDGNDPLGGYQPRPEKVAYTGTHDNQTLVGYCAARYPELDAHEAAGKLTEAVVACNANVHIVALQDVLGLGDEARMNTPGTAKGNWTWQATQQDLDATASRLKDLHRLTP